MKLKLISFFLFLSSSFILPLTAFYNSDDSDFPTESKEEYKATVQQIIADLKDMRPSLVMRFCKILDLEEDGFNRTLFYYQQQYKTLASGFHHLIEIDPNYIYMIETIQHDLDREQNTLSNATTSKTKNKCLTNFHSGLTGAAMIADRILDGMNLKQLHKSSKKLKRSRQIHPYPQL